ncbi:MoaD/ThiS family protein [Streptomyces sp. 2A115]|uniref:MoaD/ThiS family protein n=1 Tax=Streptomyces sp. 2A115 TaxID=3457439 RepID=UPI003FD61F85
MPRLLLFAAAREAAGRSNDVIPGGTLGEVLEQACSRYGPAFAEVLAYSRVWVNGEGRQDATGAACAPDDEIAVLPPISGG